MKHKIIAAGGLVMNDNNELLMILRRGYWDLPKGKLDEGETIEQCAVREVEEETGLRNIELLQSVDITLHEYFDKHMMQDVVKETHWYMMRVTGPQSLVAQAEEDIIDIKWVPEKVLKNFIALSYKNIEEVLVKSGVYKVAAE